MSNNQHYKNQDAVTYALQYALQPNPEYIYFQGNDCTNFVSQCLRAGGCENDYNTSHPWWYRGREASICWAVGASLYWYILTSTKERKKGIIADTFSVQTASYNPSLFQQLKIGDLVQYRNKFGRIQHSAIITGFTLVDNHLEPLITQHTEEGVHLPWVKEHPQTIFHHILRING